MCSVFDQPLYERGSQNTLTAIQSVKISVTVNEGSDNFLTVSDLSGLEYS